MRDWSSRVDTLLAGRGGIVWRCANEGKGARWDARVADLDVAHHQNAATSSRSARKTLETAGPSSRRDKMRDGDGFRRVYRHELARLEAERSAIWRCQDSRRLLDPVRELFLAVAAANVLISCPWNRYTPHNSADPWTLQLYSANKAGVVVASPSTNPTTALPNLYSSHAKSTLLAWERRKTTSPTNGG